MNPPPLLSAVVPMWNEAPYVRRLVREVFRVGELLERDGMVAAVELVLVDDASTDATREIAREIAAGNPRVRLLEHARNRTLVTYACLPEAHGAPRFFLTHSGAILSSVSSSMCADLFRQFLLSLPAPLQPRQAEPESRQSICASPSKHPPFRFRFRLISVSMGSS
ncbi:MAG: glycosyltransferase [Bryobacterales bacterium]|nr:glycosyltransferase [Bryobacterales bacterium]